LRPYKKVVTTAQQKNRTIHFILLIHCLAHLPFDHCIYSPQQLARYAAPTLLQSLTKTIPLFFSYTIVVILWIELVHALFEVPPEVLNRVEIG
jgi:hypothetical protein